MIQKSCVKKQAPQYRCYGHADFEEIMKEIKKKGNFEECLQTADDLYGIKQYNILDLTPKKIVQLYDSVCNRVYLRSSTDHENSWVGYQLKIFVWLLVCNLCHQISNPETLGNELWQKYSRIFHNKSLQLIQYQAKLVSCSQSQPRKWQKKQQSLLMEIMKQIFTLLRSSQIYSKWNEVAKNLYLKSQKRFFRNPKQIREHWLNHLDPQIRKSQWSKQQDYLIVKTVAQNGKKWALVAKLGGGKRTEHMIKNRYYTLLRVEEKNNQSTHDKQKLLKIILKRLQESCKTEDQQKRQEAEKKQKSGLIGGQQTMREAELQNKVQEQNIEEEGRQNAEHKDDMMIEREYYNWEILSNTNKRYEEIELVSLINCQAYQQMLWNSNDMAEKLI